MTALTKLEYQRLYAHLGRLLPPGGRPLTPEEVLDVGTLQQKLHAVVEESRPADEMGDLVLEWRIPREWTAIKSGKGMPKWILGTIRNSLGDNLRALLPQWPKADLFCARRRRWVQVRRFSDQKPDRPQCPDCLGARQAIDLLKASGVIVDDSPTWTIDDTNWIKCKRGDTHVVIRVFEIASEGRSWPEPACLPPPKPMAKRRRGAVAQHVVDSSGGESAPKRRSRQDRPREQSKGAQ